MAAAIQPNPISHQIDMRAGRKIMDRHRKYITYFI
jgi:hypothetical protein